MNETLDVEVFLLVKVIRTYPSGDAIFECGQFQDDRFGRDELHEFRKDGTEKALLNIAGVLLDERFRPQGQLGVLAMDVQVASVLVVVRFDEGQETGVEGVVVQTVEVLPTEVLNEADRFLFHVVHDGLFGQR